MELYKNTAGLWGRIPVIPPRQAERQALNADKDLDGGALFKTVGNYMALLGNLYQDLLGSDGIRGNGNQMEELSGLSSNEGGRTSCSVVLRAER